MRLSGPRSCSVLVVGVLLLGLGVFQVLPPIKKNLSQRYLSRGDTYFEAQDYMDAVASYTKSLQYWSENSAAATNLSEAKVANVDIKQAQPFFQAHAVTEVLDTLREAEGPFASPKAALLEGEKLYGQGQYVYAQYPLVQATQMDPGYPEAWNYLGLVYQQLGKLDSNYSVKAKECFKKRDALTPMYLK